jgi:CRISPR-associated protein Csm5
VSSARKLRLRLEVATPLHVWDGEPRVWGIDLVSIGNEACLLDLEKADFAKLGAVPTSAEGFERSARRWVETGAVACARRIPMRAALRSGEEVKLLPPQLVPASTLKGYIRTALLHKLIVEVASSQGAQAAAALLANRVNLHADPKRVGAALELELLARPRLRKQGGYADALQQLVVAEPRVVRASSSLSRASVVDLGGSVVAELAMEVLEPGSALEYELTVLAPPPANLIRVAGDSAKMLSQVLQLYASLTPQRLLDALAEFGRVLLEHELDKVRRFSKALAEKGFDLSAYAEALERLVSDRCLPARLGFATGHVAKTVAVVMQRFAPDLYRDLCQVMTAHTGRLWDDTTLKLVNFGGRWFGLGWVKLCAE